MAPRILSPEDDQARVLRRPPPRRLRTAKPEEGTGEGSCCMSCAPSPWWCSAPWPSAG
ncbi:hypothetical protein ACFQY5_26335 [Paeniroseomonas aquatica]|uniref:hypothetical protein n=1 Tax=Paeniroseomonas aquatica TaxID=373043 RepID=UPI00361ED392